MTAKTKVPLLAALVAALALGVTWRMVRHRDELSPIPAAVTNARPSAPNEEQPAAAEATPPAPKEGSPASADARPSSDLSSQKVVLHQARGTIVLHTEHRLVILLENDRTMEFDISETTNSPNELAKGQRVIVGYVEVHGRKIAKTLIQDELRIATR